MAADERRVQDLTLPESPGPRRPKILNMVFICLRNARPTAHLPTDPGPAALACVIYYVARTDEPVLALLLSGKSEQANPTPDQRKAMVAMIEGAKPQPVPPPPNPGGDNALSA